MTKPQKASEDKGRSNLNKRVNEMRQHADACEKRYNDMTLPQKVEENNQRARELTAKMAKTSKKKTKRCPNPVQKRRTPANTGAVNATGAPNNELLHRVVDGQNCGLARTEAPCSTGANETGIPFSASHLVNIAPGIDNFLGDTEAWTLDQLNLSDVELPNDDVIQQLLNTTDVESLIQDQESKEGTIQDGVGEPTSQNMSYERQAHQQLQMSMAKSDGVQNSQAYHRQYEHLQQQQQSQQQQSQSQQQQQLQSQSQQSQQQQQAQSQQQSQNPHSSVPQVTLPPSHIQGHVPSVQRSMQYQHDSELNALLQRNDHASYMTGQSSKSPGLPVSSMQDAKLGHLNCSPISTHQAVQQNFNQQKMSKTPPNVSLVHPCKSEPMTKIPMSQHQHPFMPAAPTPAGYEKMNYQTRTGFTGNMPPQATSYSQSIKNEPFSLPPMQSFSREYDGKPTIPSHHQNPVGQMVNGSVAASPYRVPNMPQGPPHMYDPSYHQTRDLYYRNEAYAMQTGQPHLQNPSTYPCMTPGPTASYANPVANVHAQQHVPQHLTTMGGNPVHVPGSVSHYSPQPHFNVGHPQYAQQVPMTQATAHPSIQQPVSAYGGNVYSMYNQPQAPTSDPSHGMAYRAHDTGGHMPYP